jgi:hypothetical protein
VGHPGTSRSRNKQDNESKSDKKMVNSVVDKWVKGPRTIMLAVIGTTQDIESDFNWKMQIQTKNKH